MANGVPKVVRLPDLLYRAVVARGKRDRCTVQAVLLTAAAHYLGVETPLRKRGGQPAEVRVVKPQNRKAGA